MLTPTSRSVASAFTVRSGGVSRPPFDELNLGLHVGDDPAAVIENRHRALGSLGRPIGGGAGASGHFSELEAGLGLDDLIVGEQVHGTKVVRVGRGDAGRGARDHASSVPDADALITAAPGVCLAVLVADCVPLVFFDPVRRAIGTAHAGWRGTAGRIAERTVQAMVEAFGCKPADIIAAIGPSIGPEDYAVGAEVVEAIGHDHARTTTDGHLSIDLWTANRDQLVEAGLLARHIEVMGVSTASLTERYYSHRAERGVTGRSAGLIVLA